MSRARCAPSAACTDSGARTAESVQAQLKTTEAARQRGEDELATQIAAFGKKLDALSSKNYVLQ